MKPYLLFLITLCGTVALSSETPSVHAESSGELVVYNRILAKVNGKTISVIDVIKKMDLFLQKHYPHLADTATARYQFFSSQWKDFLNQVIDTELMLADAERLELKVSDAEVREEILNRFGPNVMPALDKLGLTYDEAKTLIHDEMIVQRIIWFRVNSKALTRVNSRDVKQAYQHYLDAHPASQDWCYQVLSVRATEGSSGEAAAAKAFELLQTKIPLEQVASQLQSPDSGLTISLSADIEADEKNISVAHKTVLADLEPLTYSQPIAQVSRIDNTIVHRIFYLKKHTVRTPPPFHKVADMLREQLLQDVAGKENAQYLARLRERQGYDEKQMLEALPADFQPFAMRQTHYEQ